MIVSFRKEIRVQAELPCCEHLCTRKTGSASSFPLLHKGVDARFHHGQLADGETEARKGHQEMVISSQLSVSSLPFHPSASDSAINSRKEVLQNWG